MAEYKIALEFKREFPDEYESMGIVEREGRINADIEELLKKPPFVDICPTDFEFWKEDSAEEAERKKRVVIMGRLTTRGRIMLVIEDKGLSANGFGPIPWDCVAGARVAKVVLDKSLYISISNITKLNELFGEENVCKKVATIRKTGERVISVDLQLCELNGNDPEAQINTRAKGRGD